MRRAAWSGWRAKTSAWPTHAHCASPSTRPRPASGSRNCAPSTTPRIGPTDGLGHQAHPHGPGRGFATRVGQPPASPMDTFIQQIINGLVLGSVYALVALGYTMVYGIINLINFAHGEVLMVGALTSWTVVTSLADYGLPGWLLLLLGLIAAIVVCSILNFTIEKVAYRPLRNAPRLAPLITAMGMSLLLQTLAMIIWKPNYKAFPILLPGDPHVVFGAVINNVQILILVLTVVTLSGLMYLVNRTKLGRAMRATSENPRVAALMGVRPDTVISATFIIGAVLATIAGVMYASNYGTVQHAMGFLPGLKAF